MADADNRLDAAMEDLMERANEVAKNSYSNESKFKVGAALRL
ncbi:MAG: hypothetical protein ACRD2D_10985 [Terriglobales bacterium]